MSSHFHVDVARARTPEASFYIDTGGHAREIERIFARSWQLVGHSGQLAESGDFFTTEVCGESLLLVNDAGTLRAFLNVCRHRAGPVAEGCGRQKLFTCRYHGWIYDFSDEIQVEDADICARASQPAFARLSAGSVFAAA